MNFLIKKQLLLSNRSNCCETHQAQETLVYLLNCNSSNFVITGIPTKIIIENCEKVDLKIESDQVKTGMMEMIGCKDMSVELNVKKGGIPTIVAEKTQRINIRFGGNQFWKLYSCNSSDLKIIYHKDGSWVESKVEYLPTEEENINVETQQYVSQFNSQNTGLMTEVVIREGCGYATTKREKEEAEKRENELLMRLASISARQNQVNVNRNQSNHISTTSTQVNRGTTYGFLSRPVFPEPKKKGEIYENEDKKTQPNPTPLEQSKSQPESILKEITSFSKNNLKPTTTVVRDLNSVIVSQGTIQSNSEDIQEWEDEEEVLNKKIKVLSEIIKNGKHVVAYTGAGISTSASIPDYRGPNGLWTLRDQGKVPLKETDLEVVQPTYAHRALKTLVDKGIVKHIVSTNVDGLHRRSGVKKENLSELHGNAFIESCPICKKEYLRPFDCVKQGQRHDHLTGRQCDDPSCSGFLVDSIINFGEMLPTHDLQSSEYHSKEADVSFVLGTSMKVAPACHLPTGAYKKPDGKMVICNLQKTSFDKYSYLRIFATTDTIFEKLMKELNIEVTY